MTRKEKKDQRAAPPRSINQRLATECRKLAHECVEGTAPELIRGRLTDYGGRYCVAGLVAQSAVGNIYALVDRWGSVSRDTVGRLIEANNEAPNDERHSWVVFPLLEVADALESV